MTSSEFKRKLNYFTPLDSAVECFNDSGCNYVFKVTFIYCDGCSYIEYMKDFPDNYLVYNLPVSNHVWFDKFTRSQFNVEFGFFCSFVSKLTPSQYSVLETSLSLINLLKLFKNEQKIK